MASHVRGCDAAGAIHSSGNILVEPQLQIKQRGLGTSPKSAPSPGSQASQRGGVLGAPTPVLEDLFAHIILRHGRKISAACMKI